LTAGLSGLAVPILIIDILTELILVLLNLDQRWLLLTGQTLDFRFEIQVAIISLLESWSTDGLGSAGDSGRTNSLRSGSSCRLGDPSRSAENLSNFPLFVFNLFFLLDDNRSWAAFRNVGATLRDVGSPHSCRALLFFFLLLFFALFTRDTLVARLVVELTLDTIGIDVAVFTTDNTVSTTGFLLKRSYNCLNLFSMM